MLSVMITALLICQLIISTLGITVITLGGILSTRDNEDYFLRVVDDLRISHMAQMDGSILFNATTQLMDPNPIRSALSVCDKLLTKRVSAVVVSHPPNYTDISPISVSYTCGYYKIPVIGISARDSAFSDKRVHSSFVRTVPPYSHQAFLWIELLRYFSWSKVVLIHSRDEEGWSILHYFRRLAETYDIKIESIIRFAPGLKSYMAQLSTVAKVQSRVILLYATKEESEVIFDNARDLKLLVEGYVWIVTEHALGAYNIPIGAIGGRLVNSTNEKAHIHDSIHLLASTFLDVSRRQTLAKPPDTCKSSSRTWSSGDVVFRHLMKSTMERGSTGHVSFDENGDRVNPVYEIVNIRPNEPAVVGIFGSTKILHKSVALRQLTTKPLFIREEKIVYVGNTRVKPKGVLISTHLKIITMMEDPFVYVEPLKDRSCRPEHKEAKCLHIDPKTGLVTEYCCWGYCIDLAYMLAKSANFTFDLFLSKDGYYGSGVWNNVTNRIEWNGMIGELTRGEGDAIIGALTMTPERAQQIEFTQPFKYLGLKILVKKESKESSLASFLQPFQDTLWILVGLSVHVVALVLYLLDRFSPFGRFKLSASHDTEEDALNLSSAMWFSWGVLLNSGIGEGTPRSFSARVLGMVWAGFAMIIIASYTANLAAFLVLDRPEASISGITDPRLRNPTDKFHYATVKNSGADMYFKRHVDLSTMARTMEDLNYDTAKEAIEDLKKGKLQAFIWDSPRLEFEAARDCDLVTAGDLFGRSGFSIGLPKNSPWTQIMTHNILLYHETGEMEKLDTKWILVQSEQCPERSSAPATLGLTNMAGVFMMVAGGILGGALLIGVEITYRRHQLLKEKQLELARRAVCRWRNHVKRCQVQRETRDFISYMNDVDAVKNTGRGPFSNHHPSPAASNHYESEEMLLKLRRQREDMRGMKPADMPYERRIQPPSYHSAVVDYPRDEIETLYKYDSPIHQRHVRY